MTTETRRLRHAQLVALALLTTLAALLIVVGSAIATPLEPTLSQAQLATMLDASPTGSVPGHFKTVVKGSAIVNVPCEILGIVPQAAEDNGDLIMFTASGPVIEDAGGIASGMSGSPLYVNDGVRERLVGAVSYGEYYTTNGLGLATPIEHMMELESRVAVRNSLDVRTAKTVRLSRSLAVGATTVTTVAVAPTTTDARLVAVRPGKVVMRSLTTLMVGGLGPEAPAFANIKRHLGEMGVEIRGKAAGAAGADPSFSAALVPGSSVGMLFMRGDFWYGGVGTTTYTTADDKLVAFGHPMMFDGSLSAYMTNADVIGLWSSAADPHKVVAPGRVRGTISFDSGAGIAGTIGAAPAEVPFTCTVTETGTGRTVTHTAYVTQFAADQYKSTYSFLNALSFYPAFYQATGDQQYDGHLEYTLTIQVSDGAHDYTVTRRNTWEDGYGFDAAYLAVVEFASMLDVLTSDPDGTIGAHIKSVAMEATLSPQLRRARIADVSVPGGIHVGENLVRVTTYKHGSVVPAVVDVPLTIPEGMSTSGTIYAKAPYTNVESVGDGWYSFWSTDSASTDPPQTLADAVETLNGTPGNNYLVVAYAPPGAINEEWWGFGEPWNEQAVVTSVDLGTYLTGSVSKEPARIELTSTSSRPLAGATFGLRGTIATDTRLSGEVVKFYARETGASRATYLGEATVEYRIYDDADGLGQNEFAFEVVGGMQHSGEITAVWEGNEQYVASSQTLELAVRAKIKLSASVSGRTVRLRAALSPKDAGGKLTFYASTEHGRKQVGKAAVSASGVARCSYVATPGGQRVYAVFGGSAKNARSTSAVRTLVVR
ncbi:MAG: hypothetical protein R2826_00705 [Thermoleophilia bacterium]